MWIKPPFWGRARPAANEKDENWFYEWGPAPVKRYAGSDVYPFALLCWEGITECLLPSLRDGGKQELCSSCCRGQAEVSRGSGQDSTAAVKGSEMEEEFTQEPVGLSV